MDLIKMLNREQILHHREIDAQTGEFADYPSEISHEIIDGLTKHGIKQLYLHQAKAIKQIVNHKPTVITTSTASGKSLIYIIPLLDACIKEQNATGLYLTPSKALGQNQKKTINEICQKISWPKSPFIDTYDGDTKMADRKNIRNNANIIVSTPDMLHYSILPHHSQWQRWFQNLKYIIVDEAHTYRGILGNHVSHVFRRLRRICNFYGAKPTFVLCTATIDNPVDFSKNLTGLDCQLIEKSTAPTGKKHFIFFQPKKDSNSFFQTANLLCNYVERNVRTIVFGRSRKTVEGLYNMATRYNPQLKDAITPYKGTYTPEMRRELETRLFSGKVKGVVSTTALELGIDIGNIDVCLLCGFPGSISSTWQQGGRAGRGKQESLILMVPGEDPLDQYMASNPDYFFGQPCESAIVNPNKIQFMAEHLMMAAEELPLRQEDSLYWGQKPYYKTIKFLLKVNMIYSSCEKPTKYSCCQAISKFGLRGTMDSYEAKKDKYTIEKYEYKDILTSAFPGAIIWNRGKAYLAQNINFDIKIINLVPLPDYMKEYKTVPILRVDILNNKADQENKKAKVSAFGGTMTVNTQIDGYYLIKPNGSKSECSLTQEIEPLVLKTTGIWLTFPEPNGSILHAMAHLLRIVIPWMAMCERNDIGVEICEDTIYVYDNYEGGVGLAESVLDKINQVLERCYEIVTSCTCSDGCPACIQIPQCYRHNEELNKNGVISMLSEILGKTPPEKKVNIESNKEVKQMSLSDLMFAARTYENECNAEKEDLKYKKFKEALAKNMKEMFD